MAAEWVSQPNKETALIAILLGLLFHWSVMTWFRGMDTRLRLGRERLERVVSELISSECSACCLTKSGTWFNPPPPYTLYCSFARISGPDFWAQNRRIPHFSRRISCMTMHTALVKFPKVQIFATMHAFTKGTVTWLSHQKFPAKPAKTTMPRASLFLAW
jgi:hypothetical protein